MSEVLKTFADNLNSLMKTHNKNQEEIAKITEVSQQSVSNWLNGKQMPRMNVVQKIADYFHIEVEELVKQNSFLKNHKLTILFDSAKDLNDEEIDAVIQIVNQIRKSKGLD